MKTKKISYDDLSSMGQGYADAILDTNGFWPYEDTKEIRKWESRDASSFSSDACESIALACDTALVFLATELGGIDRMVDSLGGQWDDLGETLWHWRQGSGHEPDFGSDNLDRAVMTAFGKLGEAFVEIGRGRIHHFDNTKKKCLDASAVAAVHGS